MISRRLLLSCFVCVLTCVACTKQNSETQTAKANEAAPVTAVAAAAPTPVSAEVPPTISGPVSHVNSTRAFQYVKEYVSIGSRKPGSRGHAKAEQFILSHLSGDNVEVDSFTANTPVGKFPGKNIIAKFPGKKDGIIVIAGHYETNYPLPNAFVGANDGGSTTGLLLELANQFRGKQLDGYSVWLLWDDDEEAFVKWTDADSVYGTKHLAQKWQQDGTAKKIKAFLLLDMIGDADLDIQRDTNSTVWLTNLVYQAAATLGYQSHFYQQTTALEDDHIPFAKIGVPVVDIIDIDYGYMNSYHHTTQDTMDKLSPKSLQIVGDVVLQTIQLVNQR
ncbi:MAG: M28 family peptidase [Candidatus Korobacteraceae bacterium]